MSDEEDDTDTLSSDLICAFMASEREREIRETDRQSKANDVTDGWKTIPNVQCVCCVLSLTYANSSQSSALT